MLPGNGAGSPATVRGQRHEMEAGGGGLRAGFPGFPRGEGQSGALASRLEDKPRSDRALRGLLPPGPLLSHFPARALTICSLYFSPFPSSSTAAERPPARPHPARQSPPVDSCARALPGFAAGSEPSGGGHSRLAAESYCSRAGTLGFPSPTFLLRPTGMCSSSSLRPAPRGNTTWGPKNYKSLHPPRRGRARHGAGHFWCSTVGSGNEQKEWWGTAVPSLWGYLHVTHVLI